NGSTPLYKVFNFLGSFQLYRECIYVHDFHITEMLNNNDYWVVSEKGKSNDVSPPDFKTAVVRSELEITSCA
ncbi:MAG: hypothetical protein ACO2ZM_07785, partial [Francisellaceae bacterium]